MASTSSIATRFLLRLALEVPLFVRTVEETLAKAPYHLNVSNYPADHVCWRTETWEQYSELVEGLKEQATNTSHNNYDSDSAITLLTESVIGGRPIATFSIQPGIRCVATTQTQTQQDRIIHVIEIPSPKEGSPYREGIEHLEFVIPANSSKDPDKHETGLTPVNNQLHQETLDAFMKGHPQLAWNAKAKTKIINPDVSLKVNLGEAFATCSVKFHLVPLDKVIDYEKSQEGATA